MRFKEFLIKTNRFLEMKSWFRFSSLNIFITRISFIYQLPQCIKNKSTDVRENILIEILTTSLHFRNHKLLIIINYQVG